jgi:hypothetical protein
MEGRIYLISFITRISYPPVIVKLHLRRPALIQSLFFCDGPVSFTDAKVRNMIFRRANSDAKALMKALGDEKSSRGGSGPGGLERKVTIKQVFKRQQPEEAPQMPFGAVVKELSRRG